MIVMLGLIFLIAAAIVGVAGVLGNAGGAHALNHGFAVFGYHVTGSTGTLFLYGIVVGALAAFGLSLLLAGARRTSRRSSAARRELKQSRAETTTANQARDDLVNQRETAPAHTARTLDDNTPRDDRHANPGDAHRRRAGLFARRSAARQTAATRPDSSTSPPATAASADSHTPSQ
jgi:gas vesicle protein